MSTPEYASLLDSWKIHLQAERKSPRTIKSYSDGVRSWLSFVDRQGQDPQLTRQSVMSYTADLLDNGAEAATAVARLFGVRRFSAWLLAEGIIDSDPLLGIKPPTMDQKVVPRLTEDQCRALIKACSGKQLRDKRDEAMVRLMLESVLRAGEVLDMTVADTNIVSGLAIIRRGKGGKGRTVPFGPQTARAMDRYLRMRVLHPRAKESDHFWLGERGNDYSYAGLRKALGTRAKIAGIPNFHPHVLRHTSAQRWLTAGGSEGSLMSIAGWSRRDMLDRYTRATAADRAATEARGLSLGDF